jgi:serine/threonine protein kinase
VVEVLGYGVREGAPYLALEYIDGSSLREQLAGHGPYTWPQAKALLAQIAQGLADAHAADVVHRDLKPSNVLIGSDGVAKLADFGIAKGLDLTRVTGTSTLLGTPAYLAPEGPIDARSDLYSLGIVAYELLAGDAPFTGTTYQEVIVRHIREAPDLDKLPPEARDIVGWLLAKDPAERPQRVLELLAVLRGAGKLPAMATQPVGNVPISAQAVAKPTMAGHEQAATSAPARDSAVRDNARSGDARLPVLTAPSGSRVHRHRRPINTAAG